MDGDRRFWDRNKLCSVFIVGKTSNNLKLQKEIQAMENTLNQNR